MIHAHLQRARREATSPSRMESTRKRPLDVDEHIKRNNELFEAQDRLRFLKRKYPNRKTDIARLTTIINQMTFELRVWTGEMDANGRVNSKRPKYEAEDP